MRRSRTRGSRYRAWRRVTRIAALELASQLLSGKTGRLYKRLIAGRGGCHRSAFRGQFDAVAYAGYFSGRGHGQGGQHAGERGADAGRGGRPAQEAEEITEYELQKVKNQVLADSIQRIRNNTGLMFQLALLQTWYKCGSTSQRGAQAMLAVTADDVRRVVKAYSTRRHGSWPSTARRRGARIKDADLSARWPAFLPRPSAGRRWHCSGSRSRRTARKLKAQIEMMSKGVGIGSAPEQQRVVFEIMLKALKARAAELGSPQQGVEL